MKPALGSRFADLTELSSATVGGRALWSSDAFFASEDNLVKPHPAVWDEDRYTDRGKWMDGWEPRRRRHPGHDTAIVQLGVAGELAGVDIDTSHFLGNHAPFASLDITTAPADATAEYLRDEAEWTTVLDQTRLERGGSNVFAVRPGHATHVRLHIYPAGGVARLRVYGRPAVKVEAGQRCDLASATVGGKALACSDMFFSRMDNLLRPDVAKDMGDGWETKRSAYPRTDWVVIALGRPGVLDTIRVHTRHFKGNYPTGVRLEGLYWPDAPPHALSLSDRWTPLTEDTPLGADQAHDIPVTADAPVTHLRMTILSDGGVSRLRAFGTPTEAAPTDAFLDGLNALSAEDCVATLLRCCGSTRWARQLTADRPFQSRAHLHGQAAHRWWHLGHADWHAAFEHHPRIGADVARLREKFASTATWSEGEQAGMAGADEATIQDLAQGNRDYEARYGHIFLVCASGLTAAQMLARLHARMDNDPVAELHIAAGEQAKITALRLDKLAPTF